MQRFWERGLVASWLLFSFVSIPFPAAFQRVGAYGVAVGIIALGLSAMRRDILLSKISSESELQKDKLFVGLIERVHIGSRADWEADEPETRDNHCRVTSDVVEKLKSLHATHDLVRSNSLEADLKHSVFQLEMVLLVAATLQWGYGDLFIIYSKCFGGLTC